MREINHLGVLGMLMLIFILGANFTHAQSAGLLLGISEKKVQAGEQFTINVRVQSNDQAINAVSGVFSYPRNLVSVSGISREKSIMNFWIDEPKVVLNQSQVVFEGVILNPGFQGSSGNLFSVTFLAKDSGVASFSVIRGSTLANDGLGTNVLGSLGSASLTIDPRDEFAIPTISPITQAALEQRGRLLALPVIIEYSPEVVSKQGFFLKGRGEPNALTKLTFKDISIKSIGEQLIASLQFRKEKPEEVVIKNDTAGEFEYASSKNLLAGVYNIVPFLVDRDTNTEQSGFGVQLLVDDSKLVKTLVVLINVLGLIIPIVTLGVIIYFIPWYSWRRMQVTRKRLGLEEEKIDLSIHKLENQDKSLATDDS